MTLRDDEKRPLDGQHGYAVVHADGQLAAVLPTHAEACRYADRHDEFAGLEPVYVSTGFGVEWEKVRRYVLLLPFTSRGEVLLKECDAEHPVEVLRGRFNGWGGKLEASETPAEAARREGLEELGVEIDWSFVGSMGGVDWQCDVFAGALEGQEVLTADDLVVCWRFPDGSARVYDPADLRFVLGENAFTGVVPNLRWLLPLAFHAWRADLPCGVAAFMIREEV